jgi:hypothetical protein
VNCAGAAKPCATAEFRAGQLQSVAQDPKQRSLGGYIDLVFASVYPKGYFWHEFAG